MNSFSGVERALTAERERQVALVEAGGAVEQCTMTFDAATSTVRPAATTTAPSSVGTIAAKPSAVGTVGAAPVGKTPRGSANVARSRPLGPTNTSGL